MKVIVSPFFEALSGKICKKASAYVAHNKKTGQVYGGEYHGANQPNTEAQQQVKQVFSDKAQAAADWWAQNKPTDANPDGTADYQLVKKGYDEQMKFGNCYCYLRSLVQDDLTIRIPGKRGNKPSTPSTPGTDEMS